MGHVRTFTGALVDPLNIKPEDIDPLDIAHALALKCRFNGHCRVFYSVAEHSVHVAMRMAGKSPDAACVIASSCLVGLLHDASEAYLPDLPSPVKHSPEMLEFRVAELRIMNAVAQRFSISSFDGDSLHTIDKRMCATEARDLMSRGCIGYDPDYPPYNDLDLLEPLSPGVAERLWLDRFYAWYGGAR